MDLLAGPSSAIDGSARLGMPSPMHRLQVLKTYRDIGLTLRALVCKVWLCVQLIDETSQTLGRVIRPTAKIALSKFWATLQMTAHRSVAQTIQKMARWYERPRSFLGKHSNMSTPSATVFCTILALEQQSRNFNTLSNSTKIFECFRPLGSSRSSRRSLRLHVRRRVIVTLLV